MMLRHVCVVVLLLAAAAPPSPAQGQRSVLFSGDWSAVGEDRLPRSVTLLNGRAGAAMRDGSWFIRVEDSQSRNFDWAVLEVRLPQVLPDAFDIEFDLLAPLSSSYPVEVRAAQAGDPLGYLGASARAQRVVAHCGAVRTGVYGSNSTTVREKQADSLGRSVQRCRISVDGQRLVVGYGGVEVEAAQDVDFGRSERLALVVPARSGQEAYIGPIVVTTGRAISRPEVAGTVEPAPTGGPAPATVSLPPQLRQFSHSPGKPISPSTFQPFDPSLGTLVSVHLHVQGVLEGSILTTDLTASSGGAAPTPYAVNVDVSHELVGLGSLGLKASGPASFVVSAVASGTGAPIPVDMPFSYSFTFNDASELTGQAVPVVGGGNKAIPPAFLTAAREDFVQSIMNSASGLLLDSVLQTTVKTGLATADLSMIGTIAVTYVYTP